MTIHCHMVSVATLAGLLLSWGVAPCGAQQSELAWRLAPGDALRLTLTQLAETETAILGSTQKPAKVRIEMGLGLAWTVLEPPTVADNNGARGAARIRQRLTAIRIRMENAGGDVVQFDSAAEAPPANAAAEDLKTRLTPLLDAELMVTMSPRGELSDAEWSAGVDEAVKQSQEGPLAALLAPEALRQALQASTLLLPAEPNIDVGATWTQESTTNAALGQLAVARTYKLAAPAEGDRPAEISLQGKLSLTPTALPDGTQVRLLRQKLEGAFHWNTQAGRLVDGKVTQETVTDATYRDTRVAVRVTSTQELRVE